MTQRYETVIGLETHVELATKTKIFCACSTAFGGKPNSHTCPVCTGMPGSLPVLNREVLNAAIAVGLATNCKITRDSRFDRKNYFYPDNPQNYQISQLYAPICTDGHVTITTEAGPKTIRIHEIHMEEDAGKLIHDEWTNTSLVDYNRSGVPLLEIVSEPDMRSAEEVIAYLEKLRMLISYLGASDCKLQEGSMRADINISVRPVGSTTFGTRTEMKNLNSFKAIAHCIAGETERQIELLEMGRSVTQETRRWDENKESSRAMRSKEDAKDYRYFPDPDLPPVHVTEAQLEKAAAGLPEFREEKTERFRKTYGLPEKDIAILTEVRQTADFFEEAGRLSGEPKKTANYLIVELRQLQKEKGLDADRIPFSAEHLASLVRMSTDGRISSGAAKQIFAAMFEADVDPESYAETNGLLIVRDDSALDSAVKNAIAANSKAVEDYRSGKKKALGALVGAVMKETRGQADPAEVNKRIIRALEG